MEKVIITGANGFIGRNLCIRLCNQGTYVYAIVEEEAENIGIIEKLPNINIIPCNLNQYSRLKTIIKEKQFDAFYHLAWDGVFGPRSEDYQVQLLNISYTCQAVEIAQFFSCTKFIYPSSVLEFDCMASASIDGAKPNIRYLYYSTKLAAHVIAKTLCAQNPPIVYVQAIISNIYGAGTLNHNFINNTLIAMRRNQRTAFSSAEQLYDFIYIDDACRALELIGDQGKPFNMYYIGSGEPRKLKEYIYEMARCAAYDLPLGIGEIKSAVSDINLNYVDVHKLTNETGFKPAVSFSEGIKKTIGYLESIGGVI